MHAPQASRLPAALAALQRLIASTVSRLTRRGTAMNQWQPETEEDPVLAMLAGAPVDDEPVTDDDRQHIQEAWQAYREGRVISSEDAKQACRDAKDLSNRKGAERTAAV